MNQRRINGHVAARARAAGLLTTLFATVFGLGHVAWAAGMPVLGATSEQFNDIDQGSIDHLATELGVALLAFAGAAGALALVSSWGAAIPRVARVVGAVVGSVVAIAAAGYGLLGIAMQGLAAVGRYEFPSGHDSTSAGWWLFWYLLFAAIGISFLATAWLTRLGRRSPAPLKDTRGAKAPMATDARA